ncbi:hypothetical protein [Sporisorium scitamineum]|uniref:Uncharacterized protein n=1 Tax=Sporisorium scitamineum TaxID=49012 RepID=A0A0F7S4U2_9BASI|nr:hypothetical protein [Sporisorium scitamineum]
MVHDSAYLHISNLELELTNYKHQSKWNLHCGPGTYTSTY